MLFLSELSCPGRVWTEFGTKIFFLFLVALNPFWIEIMPDLTFLNFLIFFSNFFGTFLPESSMNGIQDYNFFFSFSSYLIPFWLKIIPERGFLIFWIFLLFFSEFSCPARVGTEFRTKIFFFSLSRPITSRFGKK